MAITYRSNCVGALNSQGSTAAVTFSTNPTAADLIIVTVHFYQTGTVSSIADTEGNSYTLAKRQQDGTSYGTEIWYAPNVTGSGTWTVTATLSSSVYAYITASSFGGVATSTPADVTNGQANSGTTATAGSVSPTGTCLYLNALTCEENNPTLTGAVTEIHDAIAGDTYSVGVQYTVTSGSQNPSWTLGTSSYYTCATGTFKEGSSDPVFTANATSGLTATGTVTGSIQFVGETRVPSTQDGTNAGPTVTFTPPSGMQANDFVLVSLNYRGTVTWSNSTDGGQTWTAGDNVQNSTTCTARLYWCKYDGTWDANPVFTVTTGTSGASGWMAVFRYVDQATPWDVSVNHASQASSTTFVNSSYDTNTNRALAIQGTASQDNNTWTVDNSFATPSGGALYLQNSSGTDNSLCLAVKFISTAGAVGDTTFTQATVGADLGTKWYGALRYQPEYVSGSATLGASSGVTATGSPQPTGTATLAASSGLTATGTILGVVEGTATFAASSGLTATGSPQPTGSATLAASSGFTVTADVTGSGVPQLVQHVSSAMNPLNQTSCPGTVYTLPIPNPVGDGNCLILGITYDDGATISSVSDNVNGTWSAATVTADGSAYKSAIYVMPDCDPGQTTITVTFSASQDPFQYEVSEFYNVKASSPGAGSSSTADDQGATLACGSFTPTNNDSQGGNLIWAYYCVSDMGTADFPTNIAPGSGFTLLSADSSNTTTAGWTETYHACQYYVQTTSASINPSITFTGDTGNYYNCLAVALKASSDGTLPDDGIRIKKMVNVSPIGYPSGTSTMKFQFPCEGNLQAFIVNEENILEITSVTDSRGSTWTKRMPIEGCPVVWHTANTSAANDLVVSINIATGGSLARFTMMFYDIVDAHSSPYDTSAGQYLEDDDDYLIGYPVITPTSSPGLTLAVLSLGIGPAWSLHTGAPSGAIFHAPTYTGETDADYLTNAAGQAHLYHTNTNQQSWNWVVEGYVGGGGMAVAVAFKDGQGGIAVLSASSGASATGTVHVVGSATLGAVSGCSATGTVESVGTATLGAVSGASASGQVEVRGAATLGAVSGASATGDIVGIQTATATLGATSGLSATGRQDATGSATLAAVSGLSASGLTNVLASATLAAVSGASATGTNQPTATATLAASSGISASGVQEARASATLGATSGLTASAGAEQTATATLAAVSGLAATSALTVLGSATFAGVTGMSATVLLERTATATMGAASTLSASAITESGDTYGTPYEHNGTKPWSLIWRPGRI